MACLGNESNLEEQELSEEVGGERGENRAQLHAILDLVLERSERNMQSQGDHEQQDDQQGLQLNVRGEED